MSNGTAILQTMSERGEEEHPQTFTTPVSVPRILERHFEQFASGHHGTSALSQETVRLDTLKAQVVEVDDLPEDLPIRLLLHEPYIVSFSPLQEWEGYVVAITDDHFKVRLVSLTGGTASDTEEVTLPVSSLNEEERGLLKPGAVLRWVIGYEITRAGGRKTASKIVFRQLPKWTKRELDEAMKEGRKRAEQIQWD